MKIIFCLILMAGTLAASNVLLFDPVSSPVAGRATVYLLSVETTLYQGASNALINPVLPNHPLQWCKTNGGGGVVAMTIAESNSIITAGVTASTNIAFQSKLAGELQAKMDTTNRVDNFHGDARMRLFAALMDVLVDEFNMVRTNPTAVLPPRNLSQVKTALRSRLDAQPNVAP